MDDDWMAAVGCWALTFSGGGRTAKFKADVRAFLRLIGANAEAATRMERYRKIDFIIVKVITNKVSYTFCLQA